MTRQIDNAWNLVDMARGLISLGKAHDLLGEALDELASALAPAARQGGDGTAPAESPQSGHEVATPKRTTP